MEMVAACLLRAETEIIVDQVRMIIIVILINDFHTACNQFDNACRVS